MENNLNSELNQPNIENDMPKKRSYSKNRKDFWKGVVCGCIIAVVLCVVSATVLLNFTDIGLANTIKRNAKLKTLKNLVDENFLYSDNVTDSSITDGLCKGYIYALGDEYSEYFTKDEYKEFLNSVNGEISGVGIKFAVDTETGNFVAKEVVENSPAESAGVKAGDILLKVDGEEITGKTIDDAVSLVRGDNGTKVTLTFDRNGKTIEKTMTRAIIKEATVTYKMLDNQIGYIKISQFADKTANEFEEAKKALEDQNMKGLIVDLQDNPGGYVESTAEILKSLLPKGNIVSVKYKNDKTEKITCDGKNEFDKPLAVLINGESASASEIFAGAIQDYKKGKLIGKKSYGKGVVQKMYPLSDDTMVKITTAEYYTPKKQRINKKGLTPDIESTDALNDAIKYIEEEL